MSGRRALVVGGIFVAALATGAYSAGSRVEQPFAFDHAAHVRAADCVLCHRGARTGARAGLPDLGFCTGCHAVAPGKPTGAAAAAWQKAAAGEVVPWNRLYRLPSHVYFSHQRHVTLAKVECATCHGDIARAVVPPERPLRILKMRDCLACHERERVTVDCTGCHR